MRDLDPAMLNLLEDMEIALIVQQRSSSDADVPLAEVADRIGIDLDKL